MPDPIFDDQLPLHECAHGIPTGLGCDECMVLYPEQVRPSQDRLGGVQRLAERLELTEAVGSPLGEKEAVKSWDELLAMVRAAAARCDCGSSQLIAHWEGCAFLKGHLPGKDRVIRRLDYEPLVVKACKVLGYGRVMQIIETAWAEVDPGGHQTTGPAQATLDRFGFRTCMDLVDAYEELVEKSNRSWVSAGQLTDQVQLRLDLTQALGLPISTDEKLMEWADLIGRVKHASSRLHGIEASACNLGVSGDGLDILEDQEAAGHELVSRLLKHVRLAPIPMVLYCPLCGFQHVDHPEPENGWTNPPHRSHKCKSCSHTWRPADVPTTGVAMIQTRGQLDGPSVIMARPVPQAVEPPTRAGPAVQASPETMGRQALLDGKGIEDNPNPRESQEWAAWRAGWASAGEFKMTTLAGSLRCLADFLDPSRSAPRTKVGGPFTESIRADLVAKLYQDLMLFAGKAEASSEVVPKDRPSAMAQILLGIMDGHPPRSMSEDVGLFDPDR